MIDREEEDRGERGGKGKKKKFKLKNLANEKFVLSVGKFDDLPHILREIGNDYVAYHENRAYPLVISALTHSRQPRFLNANTCSTRVPFLRRPLLLTLYTSLLLLPSPSPPLIYSFSPFLRTFLTLRGFHTIRRRKIHTFKDSRLIFHAVKLDPIPLLLIVVSIEARKIKFFSNRIRSD